MTTCSRNYYSWNLLLAALLNLCIDLWWGEALNWPVSRSRTQIVYSFNQHGAEAARVFVKASARCCYWIQNLGSDLWGKTLWSCAGENEINRPQCALKDLFVDLWNILYRNLRWMLAWLRFQAVYYCWATQVCTACICICFEHVRILSMFQFQRKKKHLKQYD